MSSVNQLTTTSAESDNTVIDQTGSVENSDGDSSVVTLSGLTEDQPNEGATNTQPSGKRKRKEKHVDGLSSFNPESGNSREFLLQNKVIKWRDKVNDMFMQGAESVDPETYVNALQKVDAVEMEALREIIPAATKMSATTKAVIIIGVLVALIAIAAVILALLIHNNIIHIPGISTDILHNIVKYGLMVTSGVSAVYLIFLLGFVTGKKATSQKVNAMADARTLVERRRLREASANQARVWEGIVRQGNKIQAACEVLGRDMHSTRVTSSTELLEAREDRREATKVKVLLGQQEQEIEELRRALVKRDGECVDLQQALTQKGNECTSTQQALAQKMDECTSLQQALAQKDGECVTLQQRVSSLEAFADN